MNNERNRQKVIDVLNNVANRLQQHRGIVLTESDLKCQVYTELLRVEDFSNPRPTFDDEITSIAVHTETKFYNAQGLLSQAPDLVITDPRQLSITQSINGDPVPSKGFNFVGPSILIELKFLKSRRIIDARTLAAIRYDILKGESLNRRDLNFYLFVVVFDRYGNSREQVEDLFRENRNQRNLSCRYFGLA